MRFNVLMLAVLSVLLMGAGSAPRIDKIESGVGVTYVGVNPEVGGSSPFQLTVAHKRHQVVNPSGAITINLPSVGVAAGDTWKITNRSSHLITVQAAGSALDVIGTGHGEYVALVSTPNSGSGWQPVSVASGSTYTPTLYNTLNVSASTPYLCHWVRVGPQIIVTGVVEVDPTASTETATQLGISLPIASDFTETLDLRGTGNSDVSDYARASGDYVSADTANNRAVLVFTARNGANAVHHFTFSYTVK